MATISLMLQTIFRPYQAMKCLAILATRKFWKVSASASALYPILRNLHHSMMGTLIKLLKFTQLLIGCVIVISFCKPWEKPGTSRNVPLQVTSMKLDICFSFLRESKNHFGQVNYRKWKNGFLKIVTTKRTRLRTAFEQL